MGADAIALPLLEWLRMEASAHGAQLKAVFSQPDRPKGRGQKLQANPVSEWALEHEVPLFRPDKPGQAEEQWLRQEGIAFVLVMAYGHILKKSLLEVPPQGFVNFHASLLPKFRGASPVETAVSSGETHTGVTLMRIIPRMDAGPGCDAERVRIETGETAGELRQKLARACVPLIARNLETLLAGTAEFREQNETDATYCRKLTKADGALDFSQPASVLASRINGLDPWPGCYAMHGENRLKLRHAVAEPYESGAQPGFVLEAYTDSVRIVTGEGLLCVKELQRPGGKMLPARDFLLGYALEPGSIFSSVPMSRLVYDQPCRS